MLHGFLPALDAAYENKVFSLGAVCLGMLRLLKEFARTNTRTLGGAIAPAEELPLVPSALGKKDLLPIVPDIIRYRHILKKIRSEPQTH